MGAGGVGLHLLRTGEGPPVVLLHGFPENGSAWRHQVTPLANAGFEVLVPDLRGYRFSDRAPGREAYRLSVLAEDVAAIARSTDHAKITLVGHDWGGIIAWEFAGRYPDLLDRLVILNAPHLGLYRRKIWRSSQLVKSWYVMLFQLPAVPERLLAAGDFRVLREMFRRTPAHRKAFTEADIEAYVAGFRSPGALTAALNFYRANLFSGGSSVGRQSVTQAETLIIWGERDPALSVKLLDGIDRVAPQARIHRLPRVGHWVQNEAPDEVNEVLLRFLQEGSSAQR